MEYPHLLHASSSAADERSGLNALHFVLRRTQSTTAVAPPTSVQYDFYIGDSVPSGCERVGIFHIRCTEGGSPAGSVNALSIPYTNNNDNINSSHNLAQTKASAVPYENSTIILPLHDAMPVIGSCTKSIGINRTCGSPGVTIGFFVLFPFSIVILIIAIWLILRRTNKLSDEERAIEMHPRLDQYQSASKLRLKEEVRGANRPNKVVQNPKKGFADDVYERYSACSIPYVSGRRAATVRENDNLVRLPAKELPRGADAPTGSATVADNLDRYP